MKKSKNSNCEEKKLKKSNCDKTQKFKFCHNFSSFFLFFFPQNCDNSKSQIVTKLTNSSCDKKLENSNNDKTQKLKLWQTQKHKLRQNSNTQIFTKLKNSNFDKTPKFKL